MTNILNSTISGCTSVVPAYAHVQGHVRLLALDAADLTAGFATPMRKRTADWTTPGHQPWSPPVT